MSETEKAILQPDEENLLKEIIDDCDKRIKIISNFPGFWGSWPIDLFRMRALAKKEIANSQPVVVENTE